jgi:hypothetical protein
MAFVIALSELGRRLRMLEEAGGFLRTTIAEDKPADDDVVLVDLLADATDDLVSLVKAARERLGVAQRLTGSTASLGTLGVALVACHQHINQAERHAMLSLAPYERVADVLRCGRERGGEWLAWSISVRDGLAGCHPLLFDINDALWMCWREFADHAGENRIPVDEHIVYGSGADHEHES